MALFPSVSQHMESQVLFAVATTKGFTTHRTGQTHHCLQGRNDRVRLSSARHLPLFLRTRPYSPHLRTQPTSAHGTSHPLSYAVTKQPTSECLRLTRINCQRVKSVCVCVCFVAASGAIGSWELLRYIPSSVRTLVHILGTCILQSFWV